MMRLLRRSFAFVAAVVTGFASQALTALSGPLVARILGVRGRGEIALVFAVAAVTSQITFGGALPTAIAHQLASRGIAGRDGLRKLAPRWAVLFLGPAVVAGLVLFFSESGSLASRLSVGGETAIFTAATIWYAILLGMLQGEGSTVRLNLYRISAPSLYVVVLIGAFASRHAFSPIAILSIYLGTTAVGLAVGYRMLRRPSGKPEDTLDRAELRSVTKQNFVSSTGPIDGLGIDWLLVAWLLGQFQLGLYATANASRHRAERPAQGLCRTHRRGAAQHRSALDPGHACRRRDDRPHRRVQRPLGYPGGIRSQVPRGRALYPHPDRCRRPTRIPPGADRRTPGSRTRLGSITHRNHLPPVIGRRLGGRRSC